MRDVKELKHEIKMAALEPYRFEPERVPNENHGSDEDTQEDDRSMSVTWCTCGRCELGETARECICCLEVPESENKFTEGNLTLPISSSIFGLYSQLKTCFKSAVRN